MRKILYPRSFIYEGHGNNVKSALKMPQCAALLASEKTSCSLCNPSLLRSIHALLWCGLYVSPAGLDFYKMYSISRDRYYVNFKMTASPIPFYDSMSEPRKMLTGKVLSTRS